MEETGSIKLQTGTFAITFEVPFNVEDISISIEERAFHCGGQDTSVVRWEVDANRPTRFAISGQVRSECCTIRWTARGE
jgi:hypothetical protein